MHPLKVLAVAVVFMSAFAMASENSLGIHQVSRITFDAPIRIGSAVLPAGDYTIRHSMEGQEHVMAFQRSGTKDVFKVKCTLVQLPKRAEHDQSIFELTSSGRVLHELVFRGDTAKHVF